MKEKILALEKKHGPIQINCKGNDSLPLDIILDFQGNLKKRSKDNLLKLIGRIFKLGFIAPFFVWDKQGDYFCFDGHGRIEALSAIREAGVEIPGLFPVVYIHAETDEQAREILLSISSQYGEFDEDELAEWIDGLDDEIAESLRLVDQEIALSMPEEETAGDDELPDDPEPVTKLGDLWELGGHRLLCGDSTEHETVGRLMDDMRVDLLVTDPPYNFDYTGKTKDALKIENDKKEDSEFRVFLRDAFAAADAVMKPGAVFYIWHADVEGYNFHGACRDNGWAVRQCLIWYKNVMVLGRKDYHYKHELCLYGWKKGSGHLWNSDRKQTTIINCDRPARNAEHPTMKPVDLLLYCLCNNTKEEDIVLDTFLGSGSTLIACEKTNRICYGMELDPHYCDVIVNRYSVWCEENNRQPVIKLNGKPYSL